MLILPRFEKYYIQEIKSIQMQLRVSDLLTDLHERTDIVEERIERMESKVINAFPLSLLILR